MSDAMLLGVLRMPMPENPDPMTLRQFVSRAQQAACRIEADADELEELRAKCETLRGECDVLVRLLLEADKVLSTVDDGESQDEWDRMAELRRAIMAATMPHRPEEADLLSLRACLGA